MGADRRAEFLREWGATFWRVFRRTWRRFNGRDVMLFAGGVSFFGMLAIFPGVAIAVSIYGLLDRSGHATEVVFRLTELMPTPARGAVEAQLRNLISTPRFALSAHGLFAAGIALYGAVRGVKALLAGLNRISTSIDIRGILSFNLLAVALTFAAIFAAFMASIIIVSLPVILRSLPVEVGAVHPLLGSIRLWSAAALFASVTLLYRFAMAAGRVRWKASVIGAGSATILWMLAASGFTYYVARLADFSATYGSIGAVVVFLTWIYLAAYSVFFGAALATEAEIEIEERVARARAAEEKAANDREPVTPRKRVWTRPGFLR